FRSLLPSLVLPTSPTRDDATRVAVSSSDPDSQLTGFERPLLHAVAQIAAALATGDAPSEVLPGVLERVADTVGASNISLWLGGEGELRCEARIGSSAPTAAQVRALLTSRTSSASGLI